MARHVYLNKERVVMFTDAMLAIIMTILVLNMDVPKTLTWDGFWELRNQFFAYVMAFFWLGSLWIGLLEVWAQVKRITVPVCWLVVLMLFFCSLFPYLTSVVADKFNDPAAQTLWGADTVIITVIDWILHYALEKVDPSNKELVRSTRDYRDNLLPDIAVKIVGLILCIFVWPPASMIAVAVAGVLFFVVKPYYTCRRHGDTTC
jgi:uncharacterized membrane protein